MALTGLSIGPTAVATIIAILQCRVRRAGPLTANVRQAMRDPERIDYILLSLKRVWERNPDLRLGQLIVISAKLKQQCPEVFSVEDDALLQGLLDYEQLREATT